jgi:competence protein ComEC
VAVLLTGVGWVAAGAAVATLRTERVAAPVLATQIERVDLEGWVERVEPRARGGQRFTIRPVRLGRASAAETPRLVRVTVRRAEGTYRAGQGVRLRVTLGPPGRPSAPGDFDFARLAWFQGLGGLGFAAASPEIVDLGRPVPWDLAMSAPIEQLRQAIRERIVAALPGETGEIATALITGERGGISDDTNQAYRDSGLFHILSISGLHMVIMAGAVFWVLRLLLVAIPGVAVRYPVKSWAAAGAILGAFGYLLISGGSVATVRSYVMITIMFAAVMMDRPALALRNVALAALLILIVAPESLFDAGFQMSFAAVTGLVSAYEAIRERRRARPRFAEEERRGPLGTVARFIGEIIVSTIIASLAVAPFAIYHFHNTQLLAMLANLIAIPVCNLLVMPAALGVLIALPFGLEAFPLWFMGAGIDVMTATARAVGALPGAVVKVPAITTVGFALIVGGGLWLLLWRTQIRWLGLLPIVIGSALAPHQVRPDVLIGRDAALIAVRAADGRLSALTDRGSAFELGRWLDADGDRRAAATFDDRRAFRCDDVGCLADVKGQRIAIALSPAALRDDCHSADVVILRFVAPRACDGISRPGRLVIDPESVARSGTHAIWIGPAGLALDTVEARRGLRPWTTGGLAQARTVPVPDVDAGGGADRMSASEDPTAAEIDARGTR